MFGTLPAISQIRDAGAVNPSSVTGTISGQMDGVVSDGESVHEYGRSLVWLGLLLFTVALTTPLFLALYANPRIGVGGHSIGLGSGMFLMISGLIFPRVGLSPLWLGVTYWLLVVSIYTGFIAHMTGAVLGLTKNFPMTGKPEQGGPQWLEGLIDITFKVITVMILVGCVLMLVGLS